MHEQFLLAILVSGFNSLLVKNHYSSLLDMHLPLLSLLQENIRVLSIYVATYIRMFALIRTYVCTYVAVTGTYVENKHWVLQLLGLVTHDSRL